jgi:arsenite methyltransferase
VALVPQSAIDRALGVANHLRHATLRSGDAVLDLRWRGGVDSILAAYRTGSADGVRLLAGDAHPYRGRVGRVGLSNVEPLESELEAIPLPGDSDLIISNGVINLSASKARCGNHGSPA